ncbi:MAG: sce7726 family protein [Chitinophagaceae bacterium]|nr:sce7726 family protein [Chitinophagaceae bacterium]
MLDKIVRQAFHNTVLKSAHSDLRTIVIDELGLRNGGVRADIAVVNGRLVGYEIKTEKDTLVRLPLQIQAYSEVFEKAFIILSDKHLEKASAILPDWWGIYKIKKKTDGGFTFSCIRNSRINRHQNTFTLAQLLWKREALDIANSVFGNHVNSTFTKQAIYQLLSKSFSQKRMSKFVIQYLKQRNNWR